MNYNTNYKHLLFCHEHCFQMCVLLQIHFSQSCEPFCLTMLTTFNYLIWISGKKNSNLVWKYYSIYNQHLKCIYLNTSFAIWNRFQTTAVFFCIFHYYGLNKITMYFYLVDLFRVKYGFALLSLMEKHLLVLLK